MYDNLTSLYKYADDSVIDEASEAEKEAEEQAKAAEKAQKEQEKAEAKAQKEAEKEAKKNEKDNQLSKSEQKALLRSAVDKEIWSCVEDISVAIDNTKNHMTNGDVANTYYSCNQITSATAKLEYMEEKQSEKIKNITGKLKGYKDYRDILTTFRWQANALAQEIKEICDNSTYKQSEKVLRNFNYFYDELENVKQARQEFMSIKD